MTLERTVRGRRPSSRRRGAALVLVMIFGIGALTLITTLISLSERGARDEFESHRIKALHAVLRAGIASAINEVNRDRMSGPYDPDGDGVGAILGPLVGTVRNGTPVTTSNGQVLGRYRCTIKDVGGRLVLTVVAAWPDFVNPRRQVVAAQVELDAGTPGFLRDRNALSFIGPSVEAEFEFDGRLSAVDPTFQVPAVNAANAGVHAAFTAAAAGHTIVGADPSDPGSSASGAATITNSPAGVINNATIDEMITRIDQYVTSQLPTATPIEVAAAAQGATVGTDGDGDVSIRITGGGTGITLPFGVYKVNELDLERGTLNGSGTLIVTEEFEIENGARINWDGDIIIIGRSGDAELELENGGRLDVTGTLVVMGTGGGEGEIEVESGGRLNVTGAMLMFGDGPEGEVEFELDSGSRVDINGVLVLLGGEEVELEVGSGARLNVQGSMVVATPVDSEEGEIEFEIDNGAQANFTFSNANFDMALERLQVLASSTGFDELLPMTVGSYWEEGGVTLEQEQGQDIADGNVAITP